MRNTITRTVLATAFLGLASSAGAQWAPTFYGTGEFDTNETALLLAGVSVSPTRVGWGPLLGVQTYWLRYPLGTSNRSVWAVQPYAGIANNFGTGLFAIRVGYNFEDGDDDEVVTESGAPVSVATGDGVEVGTQLEYWGTGSLSGQAIATYNLGSETFWGRGRVLAPLGARVGTGGVRLGGEVALLKTDGFQSISLGPILQFQAGRGLNIGLGVGRRIQDGDDATYFRAEFAAFPVR